MINAVNLRFAAEIICVDVIKNITGEYTASELIKNIEVAFFNEVAVIYDDI